MLKPHLTILLNSCLILLVILSAGLLDKYFIPLLLILLMVFISLLNQFSSTFRSNRSNSTEWTTITRQEESDILARLNELGETVQTEELSIIAYRELLDFQRALQERNEDLTSGIGFDFENIMDLMDVLDDYRKKQWRYIIENQELTAVRLSTMNESQHTKSQTTYVYLTLNLEVSRIEYVEDAKGRVVLGQKDAPQTKTYQVTFRQAFDLNPTTESSHPETNATNQWTFEESDFPSDLKFMDVDVH